MKTITTTEAAEILHCDRETVMEYARAGDLAGHKFGREWIYIEQDVIDFMVERIRRATQERKEKSERLQEAARLAMRGTPLPLSLLPVQINKPKKRSNPAPLSLPPGLPHLSSQLASA